MKATINLLGNALGLWIVCGMLACLPARGAVSLSDDFSDGGRSEGADPADGAWWAISGTSLAVVDDSAGLGAGNALEITPPASGSRGAVAHLPAPVTLHQDGDTITFFFRWRFTGTTALNQAQRLRFGLYQTGGTLTVADNADSPRYNDVGYYGATNPGAAGTNTALYRELAGDELTGGNNFTSITAVGGASVNAGTTPHTVLMTLVRSGTSVNITTSIDGLAAATSTLTGLTTFAFDEIAIGLGGGSVPSPLRIDDVQVEYYSAQAVEDGFTDGGRSDGAWAGDLAWYTLGTPALAMADDTLGIGTGTALQVTPASTGKGLAAAIPVQTLADGDTLALSFDWRFTGTTSLNQSKALRFGLHSSNGTPVTADGTTESDNDKGYFIATNPGASGSANTVLHRENGTSPGVLGGNDWTTFGTAGASLNAGTSTHTAFLTITRTGSTLVVSGQIDNLAVATGTDAAPITYAFDQLAVTLAGASLTSPIRIDNVTVEYFPSMAGQTVGGGTLASPATGPAPSYGVGGSGFTLVKNWDFGADGTIRNMADMNAHFQYHDQFNQIANPNYGAVIVSPDSANKIGSQPVEGVNTPGPIREFFAGSLKTYLMPLNGATTITASPRNSGSGSFMAKWRLPRGGSLLNQDMIWETRVRYVTPRYFWFALWTAGNKWSHGAEMDLIESFGYDNGNGSTNFDGRFWHSDVVGGTDTVSYGSWGAGMASQGIRSYNAAEWHTWTWLYRKDNTFVAYVDGIPVQTGNTYWTYGATSTGEPIDMCFLFDGTWGSNTVPGMSGFTVPASELAGKFYEWDYSRIYLRN
jgi:hypothetical protein